MMKVFVGAAVLVASHLAFFFLGAAFRDDAAGGEEFSCDGSRALERVRERSAEEGADFKAEWRELHRAALGRDEFEKQRGQLLAAWAGRDLGAVLDLLYGPEANGRLEFSIGREVLNREIAARPLEVMTWIREGRFGSVRQEVFSRWFSAVSKVDRMLIVAEMDGMTPYELWWSVQALTNRSDLLELQEMRRKFGEMNLEEARTERISEAWARRLVELGWKDPFAVFEGEVDPVFLRALGESWADKSFGRRPNPARMDELMMLPESARGGALQSIYDAADERGVEGVLPIVGELQRIEAWGELALPESAHAVLVVASRSAEDARKTVEWLADVGDTGTKQVLLPGAAAGYWRHDAEACLAWLGGLPVDGIRDQVLVKLIESRTGELAARRGALELISDQQSADALRERHPALR